MLLAILTLLRGWLIAFHLRRNLATLELAVLIVKLEVHVDGIMARNWLVPIKFFKKWSSLLSFDLVVSGYVFALVLDELHVNHLDVNWGDAHCELVKI